MGHPALHRLETGDLPPRVLMIEREKDHRGPGGLSMLQTMTLRAGHSFVATTKQHLGCRFSRRYDFIE